MALTEKQREHLAATIDAIVAQDTDAANKAFHEYTVDKTRHIIEGKVSEPAGGEGKSDPKKAKGSPEVKGTMDKAAKAEIGKNGESHDDPKKAKGSPEVKGTMDKAAKAETGKNGESHDDPKKAKGSPEVKGSMDKAAKAEIK